MYVSECLNVVNFVRGAILCLSGNAREARRENSNLHGGGPLFWGVSWADFTDFVHPILHRFSHLFQMHQKGVAVRLVRVLDSLGAPKSKTWSPGWAQKATISGPQNG